MATRAAVVRTALTRRLWKILRWQFVGTAPTSKAGILLGAPHTSNWDYVAMLLVTWHAGMAPKFLGKQELFRFPFGSLVRATGGIPVDRDSPRALIPELVQRVKNGETFMLVIAPKGTRSKEKFWKSGFYRLAAETGLPVTLGFIDRATRTAGFGPTLYVTGNVGADMELIRAFYADKGGIHPAKRSEPRLRDERGV